MSYNYRQFSHQVRRICGNDGILSLTGVSAFRWRVGNYYTVALTRGME